MLIFLTYSVVMNTSCNGSKSDFCQKKHKIKLLCDNQIRQKPSILYRNTQTHILYKL